MYLTEKRVKRITDDLKKFMYYGTRQIQSCMVKEGNYKSGEQADKAEGEWKQFSCYDRWGGKNKHYWFRLEVVIPEEFKGMPVVFEVKTGREIDGAWDALNPQFIIYVNGTLTQGLDVNHREIVITESGVPCEKYTIELHAYSGMKDGLVELNTTLSALNRNVERLYYNIKVPLEIAGLLDGNDKRKSDILNFLNNTINLLDLRKPYSNEFHQSVDTANQYIEGEFYEKYCGHEDTTACCVGNSHIDVAWLWTLDQTKEKTARSFATVLRLMEQYPEYVYISSQPQLYKFIKEGYPEIYSQIKERVKEGKWEADGAMWLEADCNLSSGESLVRQVLFGQRFFNEEFGVKSKVLWLPDVFGYSAALPQILKKSGVDYFSTTKISWNEYNKVPYDTFMWKGIDGTEILTHFITTSEASYNITPHATTYTGDMTPKQLVGAWNRYQQKGINSEVLVAFGYGDGGGGPTKEMLEYARRTEKGIPGCPKVKIDKVAGFFDRLENTVKNQKKLPKWVGELYLEYHRGTYTSIARNKKYNRKSEFIYQDAELLCSMNKALNSIPYPQDRINSGWETILLNQFHDILPGSSIKEVYEESQQQYIKIMDEGKTIINNAIEGIVANINIEETSVVVFNQLGFERSDIVEFTLPQGFDGVEVLDTSGNIIPSQIVDANKVIFYAQNVPAKGYKAYTIRKTENSVNTQNTVFASMQGLSNSFFDIKLDDCMNIISIFDRANGREVLKPNERANVLQAFEDKPLNFDAWDINIFYQEKMWEITDVQKAEVIEQGRVRATLRVMRKFLDSVITQDIRVYNSIPKIDFVSKIDWKERHVLLKTAFPVDINSSTASYEIQYGNVERPTHWNTSWDYARFEVCAHKWADLSEDGYGVSLMNDCKYGHDIKDGIMRLTLLKSAEEPNVDADRENHEFTYSIYPHTKSWKSAGTVQMAYNLNCPMYTIVQQPHKGDMPTEFSFIKVDADNVIIEVVKKAEDSEAIIVRMYECYNRRAKVSLTFYKEIVEVYECDLMENNLEAIKVDKNRFMFEIRPYEIKTFKIVVGASR